MVRNRLVAAVLGTALGAGVLVATAGTAQAAPGLSITASASSTCTNRDRVMIDVEVLNKESRSISVRVRTPFGSDSAWLRGGEKRTVSIRTDRREVRSGSVDVFASRQNGNDRTKVSASYAARKCAGGPPRISVRPVDRNNNDRLDGVVVTNDSGYPVRVRVLIGGRSTDVRLDPGRRTFVRSNDRQQRGVAIARPADRDRPVTVRNFSA